MNLASLQTELSMTLNFWFSCKINWNAIKKFDSPFFVGSNFGKITNFNFLVHIFFLIHNVSAIIWLKVQD